ncbi:MAG: ABC transporter ATP-binding protein [Treponema sp.]|nr:ABC transporter ATP-binding protein [Treponema sp.]
MSLIELRNVSKIYQMGKVQVKAVDGASFSIEEGEFASLSGPSGSGKSTLLNIIGLIDTPDGGSLIINGKDIYKDIKLESGKALSAKTDNALTKLRRENLGFIFQTFNLVPVLDVRENVSLPLTLGTSVAKNTMNKKELEEWIDFLVDKVGLSDWANHKPMELSGGQRQRVAVARALVTKAPIILADEPTANLDSVNGDAILEMMQNLNRELKTTFLFSTHDKKIVEMSNHVIHLRDGKIVD